MLLLLLLTRTTMRYDKSEDLNGFKRGAHVDGEDVCPGYVFHLPGSSSTPEKVIWGWNDVASFDCERCKLPATQHIVLREPPKYVPTKEDEKWMPKSGRPQAQKPKASGGADAVMMGSEERKAREAETAAFFNAGYSADGMLDEMNDPLAVNARPKPKPPPPPQQYYQPPPPPAAPAPVPTAPGDMAEGVQDPALQELLARDAAANDAFKREVERMVRDANRAQELDAKIGSAPASGGGGATKAGGVAESKNLSGCTVPMGTFADAAALLDSVALDKYKPMFEEEAMDPDTLIEVLQQQGRSALEEALKELGIKSMGHRLKIINALIVQ